MNLEADFYLVDKGPNLSTKSKGVWPRLLPESLSLAEGQEGALDRDANDSGPLDVAGVFQS